MMVSPCSMDLRSVMMVSSVIFPAGSITQTARGGASFFDQVCKRGRAVRGARCDKIRYSLYVGVEDDDVVLALGDEAANDVAAHASQADESDLHVAVPMTMRFGQPRGWSRGPR